MIAELGNYCLMLAFGFALVQSVMSLAGASYQFGNWIGLGKGAALGHFLFVLLSFLALTFCFVENDFSVLYVASNSNTALPLGYRISAVWGAHEGSLLLWVLILATWTTLFAFLSKDLPVLFSSRSLGVMGIISLGFLLFTLTTSNPFLRQFPPPLDGADLNPLLQDPGLIIHPPVLYVGYVGFSIAFSLAVASLLGPAQNDSWARWARPWTLAAWSFLTLGIALGSWWAYYELGWGGWWFWDPVENASLMPWLIGTALIHSLTATDKVKSFPNWSLLLAITAFGLSLLGTFLVRSGILTSVHAFASDPSRGIFILIFIAVVVGGALTLYAWRGRHFSDENGFEPLSRETLLLTNSVLFVVATATVLLGTLYPLIIDAMGLGKLSVGPPYFNSVVLPIMAPLLLLIGFGQTVSWKRDRLVHLLKRLSYPLLVTLIFTAAAASMLRDNVTLLAVGGLLLSFWVIVTTAYATLLRYRNRNAVTDPRTITFPTAFLGQCLGHIGFAILVIGITMVSLYEESIHTKMAVGDKIFVSDLSFSFVSVKNTSGPNYVGTSGSFLVEKNNHLVTEITAEKRFYKVRGMTMTEAGIAASLFRDLYISLGEQLADDTWSVRINTKPFVRFLWLGALIMAFGGIVALFDPRFKARAIQK